MDTNILLIGCITGMLKMGATHTKTTKDSIYFDILIGSEIDNKDHLQRAKIVFNNKFKLKLMVRRLP